MTSRKTKTRKSKSIPETSYLFPDISKENFLTFNKVASGSNTDNVEIDNLKEDVENILAGLSESSYMLQNILNGTSLPLNLQAKLGLISQAELNGDSFSVQQSDEPLKLIISQKNRQYNEIADVSLVPESEPIPNEHFVIPNKFWDLMEPYCSDITQENIKYLENIIDNYQDEEKWNNLLSPPKISSPGPVSNNNEKNEINHGFKSMNSSDVKVESSSRSTCSHVKHHTANSLMNLAIRIDADLKYDSHIPATSDESTEWIYSSNFIDSMNEVERDYLDLIKVILKNEQQSYRNHITHPPCNPQNGLSPSSNGHFYNGQTLSSISNPDSDHADQMNTAMKDHPQPYDSLKVIAKDLDVSTHTTKTVEKRISTLLDKLNFQKDIFKGPAKYSSSCTNSQNGDHYMNQSTPTKKKRKRSIKSECSTPVPGSPTHETKSSKLRHKDGFSDDSDIKKVSMSNPSSPPELYNSKTNCTHDEEVTFDLSTQLSASINQVLDQSSTAGNHMTTNGDVTINSQCSGLFTDPYANSDEVVWSLVQKQRELAKIRSLNLRVYRHLLGCSKADLQRQSIRRSLAIADADVLEAYEKIVHLKRQGKCVLKKDKDHAWKCLRERSKLVAQLQAYNSKNPLPKDLPFNLDLCSSQPNNTPY